MVFGANAGDEILWMRPPLCLATGLALVMGCGEARAQSARWESWPELDAFVGVTPATRLLFLLNLTKSRDTSYRQAEVGAYVDSHLLPHLSVRAGYSFLGSAANHSTSEERIVVALTPNVDGPGAFRVEDRNRFDFRWVGGTFSSRYRNRVRVERPIRAVTPYVMVEVYYDFTRATFTRVEEQGGAEWRISRRVAIDGGFAHKNDRSGSIDNVNAFAITVTLNF